MIWQYQCHLLYPFRVWLFHFSGLDGASGFRLSQSIIRLVKKKRERRVDRIEALWLFPGPISTTMGRLFMERGDFKFLHESFYPFYDQPKNRVDCPGQDKERNPHPGHRYLTNRLPVENKTDVFSKNDATECSHELRCLKSSAPPGCRKISLRSDKSREMHSLFRFKQ